MPITQSSKCKEDFSLCDEEEFLHPKDMDECRKRILEAGTQLASVVEWDFPVAVLVWPEICRLDKVIEEYGLTETWVTLMAPGIHEVSCCVALVYVLLLGRLLIYYCIDNSAGRYRLRCQILHML